jgi:hypothetical protein
MFQRPYLRELFRYMSCVNFKYIQIRILDRLGHIGQSHIINRLDITPCYGINITSRDSSVGIATGYGLGGGSSPGRVEYFHFSISSRPALGSTQPPIKWVPGLKRQGREADHSPPTSAEVKKMWIYTSIPPYVFMA